MFTIKSLASAIKLPSTQVLKDLALRHRRKIFCKFDDMWYQFPSTKEVIIPSNIAKAYAKKTSRRLSLLTKICDLQYHDTTGNDPAKIPIVAILGHFNHGKTTLLDNYGKTNIVDNEVHAITQVVRSRLLRLSDKTKVTFVDTPGQEIFYRMRDYGASIANVAVLVIAADDGICLQTEESIGIVETLGIPVVVCINKIDLPPVVNDVNRIAIVEREGREFIALEKAQFVPISAKKGTNIDLLSKKIEELINNLPTIKTEPDPNIVKDIRKLGIIGTGTVLNIFRCRETGTVLHTVVQHGQVKVGNYFSAGGWCGVIRKITHDNNVTLPSASAGYGVHLSVGLNGDIGDPRPLGDRVFFHAGKASIARENAEYIMNQNQMELKIGSYAITPDKVVDYRLEELYERIRKTKSNDTFNGLEAEGEDTGGESDDDYDDNTTEEEEEVVEEGNIVNKDDFSVIVKADSDLSLGSITDGYGDAVELLEKHDPENKVQPVAPKRLIYAGVGDVTVRDVTMAKAARAKIVTYGVAAEKEAARQAQLSDTKILGFECVQDVISLITNKFVNPTSGDDAINLVTKPKRRNTQDD